MNISGAGYSVYTPPVRDGQPIRSPAADTASVRNGTEQAVDPRLQVDVQRREEASASSVLTAQRVNGGEDVSRPRYERRPDLEDLPFSSRQALNAYQSTESAGAFSNEQTLAGIDLFI